MELGLMQYLELELKYCERCGTLRLRTQGSSRVYCESCAKEMSQVYRAPAAHEKRQAGEPMRDGGCL